jgi:major membrane immunogen (membrane-anchored lipoprotein)
LDSYFQSKGGILLFLRESIFSTLKRNSILFRHKHKRLLKGDKNMKRLFIGGILLLLLLSACSSNSSDEKSAYDSAGKAETEGDYAVSDSDQKAEMSNNANEKPKTTSATEIRATNRMVIYNANLRLEVKDFKESQRTIEDLVNKIAGYIVRAEIYDSEKGRMEGSITARIPQDQFQSFIEKAEELSVKVHTRNVTGEDVTEEYVDLEARLKSKKVVEERLLAFMKEAKETKDLLQISDDLERVQGEIEGIKGRMKYLENQTSMSTVTLNLFENKVDIPELEKEELNTWDKTKKQFMDSINFILAAASGIIVFLVGNSPILILLAIITVVVWISRKKYKEKHKSEQ